MKLKGMLFLGVLLVMSILGFLHLKNKYTHNQVRTINLTMSSPQQSSLSPEFYKKIAFFMREQERLSVDPVKFASMTQEAFPVLKTVTIRSHPNGQVNIFAVAADPVLGINQNYCLASNGAVVQTTDFKATATNLLPSITLASVPHTFPVLTDEFRTFIAHCATALYEQYDVTLLDHTNIVLKNKQDPRFTLLASAETVLSLPLLTECQKLQEEVKARPVTKYSAKNSVKWCFDVRFKNQIVLFPQKGELV